MPKLHPYEARLQSEHIANGHEREKPMKVIAKKPLFCLPCALHKPLTRLKLFVKGEKRIFEHSIHQCRLRTHSGEFDSTVEELLRQLVVMGRHLIPGVPVCRSRLGWPAPMGGFAFGVHLILHFCISYTSYRCSILSTSKQLHTELSHALNSRWTN